MVYRNISSDSGRLLYGKKFERIFFNIDNLFKFQQISDRISFVKNCFILYFENLFKILILLEKKNLFFLNLIYKKKILDLTGHKIKFRSINVYIKSKEISLFYCKKRENLEAKRKINHALDSKKKVFDLSCLSLSFKGTSGLFFKRLNYTPFLSSFPFFEKKFRKHRFGYKFLESKCQINSLKNLKKFLIFNELTIFHLIMRNFEFFFNIGSKYLNQLKISDLTISHIFDSKKTLITSFAFFFSKKPFFNKPRLIIKSNDYIFWKKISSHSFFLCPVQKVSSFSEIKILSCGHMFSHNTTKKITESLSSMIEFVDMKSKFSNLEYIECPWCETINEKLDQLNFELNFYISILGNKKIPEQRI